VLPSWSRRREGKSALSAFRSGDRGKALVFWSFACRPFLLSVRGCYVTLLASKLKGDCEPDVKRGGTIS